MSDKVKIEIELSPETVKWLDALLHNRSESSPLPASVKGIVEQITVHFAEGIRRPGSWEREMLKIMGYEAALTGYEKTLQGYENA